MPQWLTQLIGPALTALVTAATVLGTQIWSNAETGATNRARDASLARIEQTVSDVREAVVGLRERMARVEAIQGKR